MTWPIVEGVSLLHLHISRGKRSDRARPAHRRGRATSSSTSCADADAVIEAMRPGGLDRRGLGFERAARGQPADRVLHDLGLRHDRPVPGHAEPRHRLRHVGRASCSPRSTTTASPTSPSTPSIGIHAGPLFGALGILAGVVRARDDRRGLPARDRPVRRRRRDRLAAQSRRGKAYERPESEVTGNKSDNYERRAPGHRRHAARACATSSTRRPTATSCSWRRSRSSGRTSARASAAPTCSSGGPARSTPTTRAATPSCRPSCATIFRTRTTRRVDRRSATSTTRRSPR